MMATKAGHKNNNVRGRKVGNCRVSSLSFPSPTKCCWSLSFSKNELHHDEARAGKARRRRQWFDNQNRLHIISSSDIAWRADSKQWTEVCAEEMWDGCSGKREKQINQEWRARQKHQETNAQRQVIRIHMTSLALWQKRCAEEVRAYSSGEREKADQPKLKSTPENAHKRKRPETRRAVTLTHTPFAVIVVLSLQLLLLSSDRPILRVHSDRIRSAHTEIQTQQRRILAQHGSKGGTNMNLIRELMILRDDDDEKKRRRRIQTQHYNKNGSQEGVAVQGNKRKKQRKRTNKLKRTKKSTREIM